MSELSTVAIKDGHRGHLPHHHHFTSQPTTNTLDAERADRISRLAGLERVTTARQPTPITSLTPGASAPPQGASGYFDASGQPLLGRERSTVGSASATGSVGGRTTWASGSDVYDPDKMSESADMDTSSVAGTSDDASLVGFGEGARTPARSSTFVQREASMTPVSAAQASAEQRDAKMIDGMTYDRGVLDTSKEPRSPTGTETAERIIQERLGGGEEQQGERSMDDSSTGQGLGRFHFENK